MKISAVIFDLDGTLIDSRDQWGKAFSGVLKDLGKDVPGGHPEIPGVSIEDNWRMLLPKYQITTGKTLDELKSLTYKHYVKFLPEISLMDGAKDFLGDLKEGGVKITLATSCEWWVVKEVFKKLGLEGIFDATVTGEEIPNKKPFPDEFLLAADKLGVSPEDCLVIGDTPSDIEAAKSAGMKVVAITDKEEDKNTLANADLIVEGFAEVTLKVIEGL
jgi:HAD superfamily hydrolase (TIGR01509 family)